MRAFRSTVVSALCAAIAIPTLLLTAPRAQALTLSDQWCLGLLTPLGRVDCLDGLHPGFKVWLAFQVPHLPPPAPIPCLDQHESGTDYAFPLDGRPPNGYEGAGQWLPSTWRSAAIAADWAVFADWPVGAVPAGVQDQVMWWWGTHHGWGQWGTHWMCGV